MHLFEKTDRIDAGVIAWYAETKKVPWATPLPARSNNNSSKALVTRLRQLTEMRAMELLNHRALVTDPTVLASGGLS